MSRIFRIIDPDPEAEPYVWKHIQLITCEFEDYADSYWTAARSLTEDVKTGSVSAFPAVHLYRHAIEAYFKAILLTFGASEIPKQQVFEARHNLVRLLDALLRVGSPHGWSFSRESEDLIREWEKTDPEGVSLRYPEKKNGARKPFLDGEFFDVTAFTFHAEAILSELQILFDELRNESASD
jgi:hypothetical protein